MDVLQMARERAVGSRQLTRNSSLMHYSRAVRVGSPREGSKRYSEWTSVGSHVTPMSQCPTARIPFQHGRYPDIPIPHCQNPFPAWNSSIYDVVSCVVFLGTSNSFVFDVFFVPRSFLAPALLSYVPGTYVCIPLNNCFAVVFALSSCVVFCRQSCDRR